jgi:hypothetical protein
MKYLKKFNESKIDLEDLQKYCNECLAYLIDEGFVVNIYTFNDKVYEFEFKKEPYQSFSFDTIKEDFLTFLEVLNDKYEILKLNNSQNNIRINGLRKDGEYLIDDLMYENVSVDFPILSILFKIQEKNPN